jgi:signal transduction histidine kinase
LRARAALVVVLASIPAFAVVYLLNRADRSDARDDAATQTHALTDTVAAQYGSFIGDTETLLGAIGSIPSNDAVLAQCPDALAALVRQSPTYDNLFIMLEDGSVVCSARPLAETVAGDSWLGEAIAEGSFVGLVDDATTTGEPAFTVARALEGDDGPFVVAAQTTLDGLDALVQRAPVDDDVSVTILDGDDTVLYTRPDSGAVIGEPFSVPDLAADLRDETDDDVAETDGPDGVERIYDATDLREPRGSMVLAGFPTSIAYEGTNSSLRTRLILLLGATLVAMMVALAFAHVSVIRRIQSLVTLARRFGAGDLSARSHATSSDEIGELGRSLDAMAEELHARDVERVHLLGAIVEASEEERRRIAGDVHDDSIQVMSAHVMNLQLMRRRVTDDNVRAQIVELEESGRAATARLRDLVFELYSPTLEEHGLVAALESLMSRTFDGVPVTHTLTSSLEEEPPLPTAAVAYRIAQEAIRNARQHAEPATVSVDVRRIANDLAVDISDDGTGFDPDGVVERPGHLGLRGIRERATALGGTVTFDTTVGRGTTVRCRIPWIS